jgi:nucleotide-binding universal stress UspA family protein
VADTVVVTPGGGKPRSLADMIRENAELEMKEFLESCQVPPGVPLTSHLESGEPASTILKVAGAQGVDLVIVGTHGRTGVRHLLLGSVAEKLVRLSPVPVLTVPSGDRNS